MHLNILLIQRLSWVPSCPISISMLLALLKIPSCYKTATCSARRACSERLVHLGHFSTLQSTLMASTDALLHWGYCPVLGTKFKWAEDAPEPWWVTSRDRTMRPMGSTFLGMGPNLHWNAGSHLIQAEGQTWIFIHSQGYVAFASGEEASKLYECSLGGPGTRSSAKALSCQEENSAWPSELFGPGPQLHYWELLCPERGTLKTAKHLSSVRPFWLFLHKETHMHTHTHPPLPFVGFWAQS